MSQFVKHYRERVIREAEQLGVRDQAEVPYWIADRCDRCRLKFEESNKHIVAVQTYLIGPLFFHRHCAELVITESE